MCSKGTHAKAKNSFFCQFQDRKIQLRAIIKSFFRGKAHLRLYNFYYIAYSLIQHLLQE